MKSRNRRRRRAMSSLHDTAVRLARRGWPIFPVRPRTKVPITVGGFHAATTDERQVIEWGTATPTANIGFVPGRAGLVVLDWDTAEGRELARELGCYSEPGTAVITARGEHLYFRHPGGWVGNRKLDGSLDVRGDAGYVLLPPSVHPSGHTYCWTDGNFEFPDPPPRVWSILQDGPPQQPASAEPPTVYAGTSRRSRYVLAAVEAECLTLANAPQGTRNNQLNAAAFALARFAETREVAVDRLVDALTFAARHAGLDGEEVARTIQSAFRARGVVA
jgi:hypothetical protein